MSEGTLEKKAVDGDLEAQCALALLYELGMDRPQDLEKAASYWHAAACAGHLAALQKIQKLCRENKISLSWLDLNKKPKHFILQSHHASLGKKVLLVEDDDDLRSACVELLSRAGFQVLDAADGEKALQIAMAHPEIDLIISDLKMPRMNGIQFLSTLRKMQLLVSAKVIVMTAYAQQQLIDAGKKVGVDAWIVKPMRPESLIESSQRMFHKKIDAA